MALLTVSVVSNWTVCHASDNKILAAAARNPFSSPGSARPSFMVNKERSEAWTPPVIGPIPSLLSGLPLRNPPVTTRAICQKHASTRAPYPTYGGRVAPVRKQTHK